MSGSRPPSVTETQTYWSKTSGRLQTHLKAWSTLEKLRELGLFSLEKKSLRVGLIPIKNLMRKDHQGTVLPLVPSEKAMGTNGTSELEENLPYS